MSLPDLPVMIRTLFFVITLCLPAAHAFAAGGPSQWSPDGKSVLYWNTDTASNPSEAELWLLDAQAGRRTQLLSAPQLNSIWKSAAADGPRSLLSPSRWVCQWASDGRGLLLATKHSLSWLDVETRSVRSLVTGHDVLTSPTISPAGDFVAFIKNHRLWLVNPRNGVIVPLVRDVSPWNLWQGELHPAHAQAMKLETSYWWSSDGSALAFIQTDLNSLKPHPTVASLIGRESDGPAAYPRAGEPLPPTRLFVSRTAAGAEPPQLMQTGDETSYLARVTWLPGNRKLAVQRINRDQTRVDLLLLDPATGVSQTLLTETDAYWINPADTRFFGNQSFLWSSERTGYRHLFLYSSDGKLLRQLTSGAWEVTSVDRVDDQHNRVYFTATEKSSIERHLYRVALDGSGLARITEQAGWHSASISPRADLFLDTHSDASHPPRQDLMRIDGLPVQCLSGCGSIAPPQLSGVDFMSVRTHDDVTLDGMLIKPTPFDPRAKYPVILFTGDGPGEQAVKNTWDAGMVAWRQFLAHRGFVVFAVNNRGSGGRGHLFEEPIHNRFGAQEVSDLRDSVAFLRTLAFVDSSRIGVWGRRFGGQTALHALLHDSEDFKAGYAASPITDWLLFNPAFAERYLGLTATHHDEFRESSPLSDAAGLKSKLLISVSAGEDLLSLANVIEFQNALAAAGKYPEIELLASPGDEDSDQPPAASLLNRVADFFATALAPAR